MYRRNIIHKKITVILMKSSLIKKRRKKKEKLNLNYEKLKKKVIFTKLSLNNLILI